MIPLTQRAHTPVWPENLGAGLAQAKLPGLDGFRAVAAFLVVFYHFGLPLNGGLGVLGFFVLSGFLITWLLLKEDDRNGGVSLTAFYARRTLRIFPAFYCYWLLVVMFGLVLSKPLIWPQAWSAFFYVNNYYQGWHGDPDTSLSHTWSLSVEEQFYVLWPFLFVMLRANRRRLFWFLTAAILAVWVWRLIAHLVLRLPSSYLYEAFDLRADHLFAGCWLAVALREKYLAAWWRFLCSHALLAALTSILLGVSMVLSLTVAGYRDSAGFMVEPVLIAMLLVQLIAFRDEPVWSWMNWPWMRFLGTMSYSIYLYQQIAVGPAKKALATFPAWVQLIGVVVVVVGCAAGSYFFIERPFLSLKRRFTAKLDQG